MNEFAVVGFRPVSFVDQNTKKQVEGYTLFLERTPTSDEDIQGVECVKQFISSQSISYVPHVGDAIRLLYNRYGKIGSIEIM